MKAEFSRGNRYGAALLAGVVAFGSSLSPAVAETVGASESQGVNLTIYNQNFGLVRDIRNVDLKEGLNFVKFEDVAAQIDPTSVSFTSLTAPNSVAVREQNYQYDLIDPTTILSKSIGKTVKFKQFLPSGAVNEISGVLLNSPRATVSDPDGNVSTRYQGLVLKTDAGVVLNPAGQAELAELPGGLVSKPSLLWKLETTKAGTHKSEIAYQTQGMSWKCDYVAIVNDDDTQLDMTSWVTLDNKSGAGFKDAALKLMAGDVHKVQPPAQVYMRGDMMMKANGAPAPQFSEQSFAEYHLYTLAGKTDVNNNETKQLSLFNAARIPTKKQFVFDSRSPMPIYGYYRPQPQGSEQKINVKLEIQNTEANQLGMALPKGKVRVYKKDKDGALQFIGEDLIDHTPRDEKIRLYIGDAFDLVGERKQMNMNRISDRVYRTTYEVSLRNHKDKDVTITAVEHAHGEWKIISENFQHAKKDSTTFEYNVKVPARGEVKLNYEIEIRS